MLYFLKISDLQILTRYIVILLPFILSLVRVFTNVILSSLNSISETLNVECPESIKHIVSGLS